MQGAELRMSSTYHPELDGQTEVVIDYWTSNFAVLHQKSRVTWFIGLNFGTIQHFMSPLGEPLLR